QSGLALSRPPSPRAPGLDRGRVEGLGAGPPRQVLPPHRVGPPSTRGRSAGMGAHGKRHRPRDEIRMTLNDLKLRARALLRPNRVEQELAFHIEREARTLIDEGMTPAEARERAQARFGSTALAADRCRDQRGTAVIDNTIRDVQYAFRTFAKAPLAAFTIVVTMAIGLGVVAVLFTVLNT